MSTPIETLTPLVISTPAAEGKLYAQGAHITEWTPRGQKPVLFTSARSFFIPGKAIRGGVPVIFPWFGPRGGGLPGPMHGYARTSIWSVDEQHDGEVRMSLASDDGVFKVGFRVVFGATLEMQLDVHNISSAPVTYEEALHTYFAVGDIAHVSVTGLANTTYIDKTDGAREKVQGTAPITIAKETDAVYLNAASTCVIHDPVLGRDIIVEKSGSQSTVVWNPWIDKCKAMADMAPDEWRTMLCVESANAAANAVTLAPGASHQLAVTLRVA